MGLEYSIRNMPSYPQNGDHQRVIIDLPECIDITKGEDPYFYINKKGKRQWINPKNWVVHFDDNFKIAPCREFKTHEKAVKYAVDSYVKHLKSELKKWS